MEVESFPAPIIGTHYDETHPDETLPNKLYPAEKLTRRSAMRESNFDAISNLDGKSHGSGSSLLSPISKYDLPIELQYVNIKEWRAKFASILNRDIYTHKRQSVFRNLKPEILSDRLQLKRNFYFVRNIALQKLLSDIYKMISIVENNLENDCDIQTPMTIPYRLFSWAYEDFLKRRDVPNLGWLDIIKSSVPKTALIKEKFKSDLAELRRYTSLIFKGIMRKDGGFNVQVEVVQHLQSAVYFLQILETLEAEVKENKLRYSVNSSKVIALSFNRRDSSQILAKQTVSALIRESQIVNPIEMRYQLKFMDTEVTQTEYKYNQIVHKLEEERDYRQGKKESEVFCSLNATDIFHAEIESLKSRIAYFTAKFNDSVEEMENTNISLRSAVDKLRIKRKFLQDEIVRFHEEKELRRLKDIAALEKRTQNLQKRLEAKTMKAWNRAQKKLKQQQKKVEESKRIRKLSK